MSSDWGSKALANSGSTSSTPPEAASGTGVPGSVIPAAGVFDALARVVGARGVLQTAEELIPYAFDGTAALSGRPLAVVFPADTSQVAACVRILADARVPIVARG